MRAVDTYLNSYPADGPGKLDLSWTVDERSFLNKDPTKLISTFMKQEIKNSLQQTYSYAVDDPYGNRLLAPALEKYFTCSFDNMSVFCGAGVNSLLQFFSSFRLTERATSIGSTYPDFHYWCKYFGREREFSGSVASIMEKAPHGGVYFSERPFVFPGDDLTKSDIRTACEYIQKAGGILVIDESNSNYCEASYSCVSLINQCPNLIILRGLSKAYGLGGLRFGAAITSKSISNEVRKAFPVLQTSTLSLGIASVLYKAGDITIGVKDRIYEQRGKFQSALRGFSPTFPLEQPSILPYVLLPPEQAAIQDLNLLGIFGKMHLQMSPNGKLTSLYRMSIPLQDERWDKFESMMAESV